MAYPSVVAPARRLPSPLSDHLAAEPESPSPQSPSTDGQLLHACLLTSTTLVLVGLISKARSNADQPLDRRKSFGSSEKAESGAFDILLDVYSLWRMLTNVLSILLPFYATMQLGGARTGLILLAAVTGALGSFDQKPGKHTAWENTKRTFRTRHWTCGSILLGLVVDLYSATNAAGILLGYLAVGAFIAAISPPLPTTGWLLMTGTQSQTSGRASLPKPSSPLINTAQDTFLTLASGVILTLGSLLYLGIFSTSSLSVHANIFSILSVASATALVYFSLPSALRNSRKGGLALGTLLVVAFGIWEHSDSWQAYCLFPLTCASIFGAIIFDTHSSGISRPHSHSHSHAGHRHSHSHDHSDHHLHGNHSKISAFLIARCTPGSITHSIMIEKDSRRIAYFGM